MKPIQHTASLLLLAATLALSSACDPKEATPPPAPTPVVPAAPVHQPTAERAMERAQERWAALVKADYVASYNYNAPEIKREQALANYLAGMAMHRYENMRATKIVGLTDKNAFVHSMGLWTPQNPQVQRVKLEPGQTLTQEIEMIETWRWVDGDWCFLRAQRDTEFFEEHPELLKAEPAGEKPAK